MVRISICFLSLLICMVARAGEMGPIAAGEEHTVVVKPDGTVWAWGRNDRGQLGDGSTKDGARPARVEGLGGVQAVAAGATHTLALARDGSVWAFGAGHEKRPAKTTLTDIVAIAGGGGHSLALKKDGTVWAWGLNHRGQLGNGTTNSAAAAARVTGLSDVVSIAAGRHHSVALRKDGTVWVWGANSDGRLGDGTAEPRLAPVQVKGLADGTAIAAGYYHTLALKKDGTVFAWGQNWSETWQLADGTTMTSFAPVPVTGLTNVPASGEAVIPTEGNAPPFAETVKIACGAVHSLAIRGDGILWAWGGNHYWGQLGDGTAEWRPNPVPTRGLTNVIAVAGGRYHSVALLRDGSIWTWGGNLHGQLGNGAADSNPHPTPSRVNGL